MKKRMNLVVLLGIFLCLSGFLCHPVQANTEKDDSTMILCEECQGHGLCMECYGLSEDCETCLGTHLCMTCQGEGYLESPSRYYNTAMALFPAVIAISLALLTKEVYSSLFVGIVVGGLLYANFSLEKTWLHVFNDGVVSVLSDPNNVGILIFLVILGIMVCLMNKAGGSLAFGQWAKKHIKSRVGAQLATILLGCLIFIDDYFNCLTVGSVMRPITDEYQISRSKLAYLIDSTAAPVCIIAPISSWAAAVAGFAEEGSGLALFIQAIPYNFYAIFTIIMMLGLVLMQVDFGLMREHEKNAIQKKDLFSGKNPYMNINQTVVNEQAKVLDLVFPILSLIICCVIGMIYSGGFFSGVDFITAFSNSIAAEGLMLGSAAALVMTFLYYLIRRSLTFKEMMECIPEGFKTMVPAILILTFAWTLKAMTDSLGAKYFVANFVYSFSSQMQLFLPAFIFIIGCGLAFATGTSWGTFGILIPIVQSVFH